MHEDLVLGIDIGTQSVRAGLFTRKGNPVAQAHSPLMTSHPQPGWAEQQPDTWWQALCDAVTQCLAHAGSGAATRGRLGP